MSKPIAAPDLTKRPPRSPRVRLGGFVILPRAQDKGRAQIAGTSGEYHYACGLDQRFFEFTQVKPEALLRQLKAGKGDGEILEWILKNALNKPKPWDIAQSSAYNESRSADSIAAKERVVKEVTRLNKNRTDIVTGFDLLDLDDHVTFGGKA